MAIQTLQNVLNENSTPAEIIEEILRVSANHLTEEDLPNTAIQILGIEAAVRATLLCGKISDNDVIELRAGFVDKNTVLLPELLKDFLIAYPYTGDNRDSRLSPFYRVWARDMLSLFQSSDKRSIRYIKETLFMLFVLFPVPLAYKTEYNLHHAKVMAAFSNAGSLITPEIQQAIETMLLVIVNTATETHRVVTSSQTGVSPVKYHSKIKELLDLINQLKLYLADWYFVEDTKFVEGRREYINLAKSPLYKVIDLYHKHLDRELNDHRLTHLIAKLRLVDTQVDNNDFYGVTYRIIDDLQKILVDEFQHQA